ncbi:hypothetical protein PVK06_031524 [Gossypium arboreum]|uniref:Uncharacterized protein n=1 Tax=Gossypium arboreum TaxID=29729 RepID=A0ABR0NR85_GOSAR|nr:hypothetical protein PVK06_031524 [Gossypium arboreum]
MFNLTAIREFLPGVDMHNPSGPECELLKSQLSNSSVLYHLPSTPQAIDDGTTFLIEEVAGVHPTGNIVNIIDSP